MRIALAVFGLVIGALVTMAACGSSDVSRVLGARCNAAADCDDRCLGPSNDYPGGFCTVDCDRNLDCPSSADCADLEGGVCLFRCRDDRDCEFLGLGWICEEENLREDQNRKILVCRGD
jgi:hypothetical protein